MGDMTGDRGWLVLEKDTPLARLVAAHPVGDGLPCCSFVACWSLCVAGMVGEDIGTELSAWARLDLPYWKLANITSFGGDLVEYDQVLASDDDDREWDSLEASLRLLGGRRALPVLVCASQPAPALEPGRWHAVQRWKGRSGHNYLVKADAEGAGVVVVQSSVRLGTRIDEGTWEGTAGLSGYRVGVVALPSLGGP